MARADLLLALARSALHGDAVSSRAVVEAIAAEEGHKRHTVLAKQLADELKTSNTTRIRRSGSVDLDEANGVWEVMPKRRLDELVLPMLVKKQLLRLIEEQHRYDLLRSYGVEPRHSILLVGPPGNGKTSCAEAIATELALPLLVLRYEQVIASFLGETAARLEAVLDQARQRHCVLLLDEFDVLAKERSDDHETGEVKRVVSSLLLQIDRLPSHVVIVAATNHSQLLDTAVWRRFELQVVLPQPSRGQRLSFAMSCAEAVGLDIPRAALDRLVRGLGDCSYGDVETALLDLRRRQILSTPHWQRSKAAEEVDEVVTLWRTRPTWAGDAGQ